MHAPPPLHYRPSDSLRSDDVLEKLRDFFPPRPDGDHMPAPNPANGLNVDVRVRILAAVPKVLRTLPRRSGLGPSGSRFEHWMTIRGSDEGVRLAAELLVRLIEGRLRPPLFSHIYRRRLLATRNPMTRKASVLLRSAASFGASR